MKNVVARYQTLIGCFLICLTILVVSGKGGNVAAYFSSPAYAAASDVQGSKNVAIAAFHVTFNAQGPLATPRPAILEIMSDGGTGMLYSDYQENSAIKISNDLTCSNCTPWRTIMGEITFPHNPIIAYDPNSKLTYAAGSNGRFYVISTSTETTGAASKAASQITVAPTSYIIP